MLRFKKILAICSFAIVAMALSGCETSEPQFVPLEQENTEIVSETTEEPKTTKRVISTTIVKESKEPEMTESSTTKIDKTITRFEGDFDSLVAIIMGPNADNSKLTIYAKKVLVQNWGEPEWEIIIGYRITEFDWQFTKEMPLFAEKPYYDPFRLDNMGVGPYWSAANSDTEIYNVCIERLKENGVDIQNLNPYEEYKID